MSWLLLLLPSTFAQHDNQCRDKVRAVTSKNVKKYYNINNLQGYIMVLSISHYCGDNNSEELRLVAGCRCGHRIVSNDRCSEHKVSLC